MENAVDALKIAFAVFAFVSVLAISLIYISQAKSTGDYVLYYNDKTNFYNNLSSNKDKNRNASITDVISTLYRYKDENLSVTVKLQDETYNFDTNLTKNDIKKFYEERMLPENSAPSTDDEIEDMLNKFISEKLNSLPEDTKFLEEFVEVPYSGWYDIGADETEVTLSAGDKKIYITYTCSS